VHVPETVICFADDAFITPSEARKLADALVELADYAPVYGDRVGERRFGAAAKSAITLGMRWPGCFQTD
jgi:hypothetical protein